MTFYDTEMESCPRPHNAEYELRKAYNAVIETNTLFAGSKNSITGINPNQVSSLYQLAYYRYQRGNRLAAERWARAAKHLARAFWHEAKIHYLLPRLTDLPHLAGSQKGEYGFHEHSDTTVDLLESVANHIPAGMLRIPDDMKHFSLRAKEHLGALLAPESNHELLRAERVEVTYEYARVLECLCLAYEAENQEKTAA